MGKNKGNRRPPAAKRPPLTHFLCLPLVTATSRPQFEASLRTFKNDVCGEHPIDNVVDESDESGQQRSPVIHPAAIRPVGALHCTLGVMSLGDNELAEAIECLRDINFAEVLRGSVSEYRSVPDPIRTTFGQVSTLQAPISPPPGVPRSAHPLRIDLRGLVSMHNKQNTSILYSAPSDPRGRLLQFCLAIQELFKDRGFLAENHRELKLHATLVNTIYAKSRVKRGQAAGPADRSEGHGPNAKAPLKMDATAILEKYEDFVWAENVVLDRVAICEMGAKKVLDAEGNVVDEEYTEVATMPLPMCNEALRLSDSPDDQAIQSS